MNKIVNYGPINATEDDLIKFYRENKDNYEGMTLYLGAQGNFIEYFVPYKEEELLQEELDERNYLIQEMKSNPFFEEEKIGEFNPKTSHEAKLLNICLSRLYFALKLVEAEYKTKLIIHNCCGDIFFNECRRRSQSHYDLYRESCASVFSTDT